MWVSLFIFSRRRRHTRSKRDWSSDVCSSDLAEIVGETLIIEKLRNLNPLALLVKGIGWDTCDLLISEIVNRLRFLHHGIEIGIRALLGLRGEEIVNAVNFRALGI